MNKNVKRTLLAVMVSSMLAASFSAIPVAADDTSVIATSVESEGVVALGNQDEQTAQTAESINSAIASADTAITITLENDITGSITVPATKIVTIELNGHTITNTASQDTITVAYGATLTINGTGTVDNVSNARAAIYNSGTVTLNGGTYDRSLDTGSSSSQGGGNSYYTILNHGSLTINAPVTVQQPGRFSSLIDNGYYEYANSNPRSGHVEGQNHANPTLTINGGTFSGGVNTIKNDDGAILNIYDGTFTNVEQYAVMNWNQATITGGNFTSNTMAAVQNCGYTGLGSNDVGKLVITGGSFTGVGAAVSKNDSAELPEISGGSYNTSVPDEYLADSVEATVKSGSGRMVVYTDIQNAVNAASAGDTVSVKQDNLSATVDPNKGIKFDTTDVSVAPTLTTPSGEKVEIDNNGSTVQTTFTATVNNVSTSYTKGQTVTISTPEYYNGHVFKNWVVSSGNVTLANPYSATTTFVMPAANVTVYAVYDEVTFVPVLPEQPTVTAPARDGWVKIGARWYLYDNGEKLTGWQKDGNTWYYLDEKGIMLCGGLTEIDGQTYYFYDWGGMASSWWYEDEDGNWFYFRGNGSMATSSWIEWKGEYYYVGADGKMLTNTTTPDGYRVDANGVWVR